MTTSSKHREHRQRDRRPLAEQAGADTDLIGVGSKELRGVRRPAAGQHVDELEVGEGLDDRKQHHHHGDRQQQRPGHVPETLPRPRPVDRRRFLQFGIDGLQSRQQADRVERHAAPDVDDDDRSQREPRLAQPVDAAVDQAEPIERPIDHAEGRIEHPFPGKGRKHGRNDEGQQDEGAGYRLALEVPVEQQRQPEAERELEHRGHDRIDERIPHRGPENAVVRQHREIVQPDEAAGDADLGVGHRQLDAFDEGIGDEQAQQRQGRQQQDEREPALVFQHPRHRAALHCAGARLTQRVAGNGHFDPLGREASGGTRCRGLPSRQREGVRSDGHHAAWMLLNSASAHFTASSADVPCTALAYMSVMRYLLKPSAALRSAGPA